MATTTSKDEVEQQDQASIIQQQTTFWDSIWRNETLPKFDVQCPSPCLLQYIHTHTVPPPGRALVPGCGRGYDLLALASSPACTEVIGLDLSPTGAQAARTYIAEATHVDDTVKSKCRVEVGDFFAYENEVEGGGGGGGGGGFDFIYDYTFLCALPPELREDWAKKMASLLKKKPKEGEGGQGGLLMTLIFPICQKEGGPPYKVSLEALRDLLEPVGFQAEKLELLPKELCHPGRDGTTEPWKAMSGVGLWRLV